MSRIWPWVAGIALVWFVVKNPDGAAGLVHHLEHGAESIGNAFAKFAGKV